MFNILRKTGGKNDHYRNPVAYGYSEEYYPKRVETKASGSSKVIVQSSLIVQPKKSPNLHGELNRSRSKTGGFIFPLRKSVPGTKRIAPAAVGGISESGENAISSDTEKTSGRRSRKNKIISRQVLE